MTSDVIRGVEFEPRRIIADERGAVLHYLRLEGAGSQAIREVYFSEVKPGVVKGWSRHRKQTQRYIVPVGRVKVVLFDDRPGSETAGATVEYVLGRPDRFGVLIIPPLIWYAFTALGEVNGLVVNGTNYTHDPDEYDKRALTDAPVAYDW